MIHSNTKNLHGQQGFATILVVLLVGLALAASMLGTAYYVRSSQNSLVADHALTNVQSGAWTGIEATRQYLETLDKDKLTSLATKTLTLTIPNATTGSLSTSGEISAYIDAVTAPTGTETAYQVTATLTNKSNASKAASKVQVIYLVTFGSSSSGTDTTDNGTNSGTSVANIYSDFDASGGITITQNGASTAVINVDGNFTTGGVSLTGIKTLNVTGNVTLTSATQIPYVYTNGYILLQGGAAITEVGSAKKYITDTSGGTNGSLYADGIITLSNGKTSSADTLSNIIISSWPTLTTGIAKGTITCPSQWWTNYTSLKATGFSSCPSALTASSSVSATGALVTVSISSKPIVNALTYEDSANYIFSVDSSNNIKVTVQNVSGITKGTYYLATNSSDSYNGSSKVYLCASGTSCSNPVGRVASPYWSYNPITYSSGTWSLSDTQYANPAIAPGVILFKGNVSMTLGTHYVNTILATGNITYGGSIVIYAPNYAGATAVCNTSYGMPTNLCSSKTALIPASIGNIALLAGSCADSTSVDTCSANYIGGNITLGASAKVYGNIIAGNLFNTSGSTTIVGGIAAVALGNSSGGSKVGGSTNIDLTSVSDHTDFTPGTPDSGESENTSDNTASTTATIKWARYL
ncbi:hypothetical protein F4V57_08650 [Acinetobacter qingfengensis]|uniref:Uncharacterized protein n=1 Tax=Acinetobacter qingfengensis TaxID=1262585 RepID=A0A1E7R1C5_9GAMM|nr:hypothetical protein [Acinetobacter qingfengensis]KAA8733285.1 hypothetical protein F4V57_08650 [Acinetobacter qingfengensis]OEY93084.1 hypothetical protein BJI46_04910 [Acinetobacter qingfengensis]